MKPPTAPGILRNLLEQPELLFLMEAHDGLSARIAEAEGFQAIWASGFSIASSLALRDSNEATWSQLLDVVEYMAEAVSVPIVVDGDTGFGDFNTARRFTWKAERTGAAGVCIEDKLFPKMNSFVGSDHPLAHPDEFAGKIRACKEGQTNADFVIIARTEALIAGRSIEEGLERARAYADAGADAIFIHSRSPDAAEIEAFTRRWEPLVPVIISPTTYASTPSDVFRRSGVAAVIWANQSMRAAVAAMRAACREIRRSESVDSTQTALAALTEIFELLQYQELERAKKSFGVPIRQEMP